MMKRIRNMIGKLDTSLDSINHLPTSRFS